mmetsp:Transcript_63351/g.200139  ORF Transcript_63351/g.200139 Transcript_63351/m.200139 type:complete len:251 (+) Transcript_63351:1193-1945(+)
MFAAAKKQGATMSVSDRPTTDWRPTASEQATSDDDEFTPWPSDRTSENDVDNSSTPRAGAQRSAEGGGGLHSSIRRRLRRILPPGAWDPSAPMAPRPTQARTRGGSRLPSSARSEASSGAEGPGAAVQRVAADAAAPMAVPPPSPPPSQRPRTRGRIMDPSSSAGQSQPSHVGLTALRLASRTGEQTDAAGAGGGAEQVHEEDHEEDLTEEEEDPPKSPQQGRAVLPPVAPPPKSAGRIRPATGRRVSLA